MSLFIAELISILLNIKNFTCAASEPKICDFFFVWTENTDCEV